MEPNQKQKKDERTGNDCCGRKRQQLTRRNFIEGAVAAGAAAGAGIIGAELTHNADAAVEKSKLDPPRLSCGGATPTSIGVRVCAGNTGLPAGFSLQWMTKSDFLANGAVWPSCTTDACPVCHGSFSGVPGCSQYDLGPNQCITIVVGDELFDQCGASSNCADVPLDCDTEYVFRAFGHNVPHGLFKSDFSSLLTCKTLRCTETGCTLTQGYWKTHGPSGCNPSSSGNVWPVSSLTVGAVTYTDLQLCSIFNQPAAGNGLLSLAHQLIAAKLNVAKGTDGSAIAAAMASADVLIGSLVIPPVGAGYLTPSAASALTAMLDDYNTGLTGPGHCR